MATKLVELSDGVLAEVEVPPDQAQQISGGAADRVSASLTNIEPILVAAARPLIEACRKIRNESKVNHAQVELGLSFEGEGNLYIAKTKANASIAVTIELASQSSED